jgi:hypothetical protein
VNNFYGTSDLQPHQYLAFAMHAFYNIDSFSLLEYALLYDSNVIQNSQSLDTGAPGTSDQFVQNF